MGKILWFTGYPCSGKTTLATMLKSRLENVRVLDGDELRKTLSKDLGFSPEDRKKHNERVIKLLEEIKDKHDYILVCLVSPLRKVREEARRRLGKDFVEVFVSCPLAECIKRDVKGHYKKALKGEIKDFTGVHQPYEEPLFPEIIVYTAVEKPEESVKKILDFLGR